MTAYTNSNIENKITIHVHIIVGKMLGIGKGLCQKAALRKYLWVCHLQT